MTRSPSVHASAVLVGNRAVLIRGPSGAGKSRLAFDLILAGRSGQLPAAILVGDDRVYLDTAGEQLWVRPAEELAESAAATSLARPSWAWWSISVPRTRRGCHRRRRSKFVLTVFCYHESPLNPGLHPCRWLSLR